ncbi:hypothetical protein MRX96_032946 [Rhipicephalus microplus]
MLVAQRLDQPVVAVCGWANTSASTLGISSDRGRGVVVNCDGRPLPNGLRGHRFGRLLDVGAPRGRHLVPEFPVVGTSRRWPAVC